MIPRLRRVATPISHFDPRELRDIIEELNASSDQVGCVIFGEPRISDIVAVIFAGNLERYFMFAMARTLDCPVIYVQDPISPWYQGSTLLPDLDAFCRDFLKVEVGSARVVLFGQSSGAYAALVASTHLRQPTVVACAPQTFSDREAKNRFTFIDIRALHTPEGLVDLRQRLASCQPEGACLCVLIAMSEAENPATAHWWGDYLHMLRLVEVPGIMPFIINANAHVIVHGRLHAFADLLSDLVSNAGASPGEKQAIVTGFLVKHFGKLGQVVPP